MQRRRRVFSLASADTCCAAPERPDFCGFRGFAIRPALEVHECEFFSEVKTGGGRRKNWIVDREGASEIEDAE